MTSTGSRQELLIRSNAGKTESGLLVYFGNWVTQISKIGGWVMIHAFEPLKRGVKNCLSVKSTIKFHIRIIQCAVVLCYVNILEWISHLLYKTDTVCLSETV